MLFNTVTTENLPDIIREVIKKKTDIVILLYAVNELLKVYLNKLLNIIWENWLVTVEDGKNLVQSISINRSLVINQSLGKSRKFRHGNTIKVTFIER